LNPGPHGPETCWCRVLRCPTDSRVVLANTKSTSLVSFSDPPRAVRCRECVIRLWYGRDPVTLVPPRQLAPQAGGRGGATSANGLATRWPSSSSVGIQETGNGAGVVFGDTANGEYLPTRRHKADRLAWFGRTSSVTDGKQFGQRDSSWSLGLASSLP